MTKENVISTCYSLLRKRTPLNFDCGKICDGKCCKGDENTGMLLFPGEEKLVDENIKIKELENGFKLAVCNGTCDRNKRPLACRIYPLFPYFTKEDEKEIIKVIIDIRNDCPIANGEYEFRKDFIKAVRRVGKYLLLNDETARAYKALCKDFDLYFKLL